MVARQRGVLLLLVLLTISANSAAAQNATGGSSKPLKHKESLNACLKKAGVHTVTGGMEGTRKGGRMPECISPQNSNLTFDRLRSAVWYTALAAAVQLNLISHLVTFRTRLFASLLGVNLLSISSDCVQAIRVASALISPLGRNLLLSKLASCCCSATSITAVLMEVLIEA